MTRIATDEEIAEYRRRLQHGDRYYTHNVCGPESTLRILARLDAAEAENARLRAILDAGATDAEEVAFEVGERIEEAIYQTRQGWRSDNSGTIAGRLIAAHTSAKLEPWVECVRRHQFPSGFCFVCGHRKGQCADECDARALLAAHKESV